MTCLLQPVKSAMSWCLCLQTHFRVFQTFVKQLRFANIELQFNVKQEDMTIRKIRGKHNHSPTLKLSIFDGSAVLIRLYF